MTYAPMTPLERQCWGLVRRGASIEETAARLDLPCDRARWGVYGAASVIIREWQRRQSRAFLRRLYRQGRAK